MCYAFHGHFLRSRPSVLVRNAVPPGAASAYGRTTRNHKCRAQAAICLPPGLTPYGGWWRWGNNSEHNDFVANVAHSGDAAPDYDIEAPRFDHHGRTWASWTHTAFMRQAVACATAVATFGGATYAAKCEMRDLHNVASHHQVGELAEDTEPLEPMPEPMCAA